MRPRSALKDYQVAAAARAVEQRRLALLLPPGDGKTVVALTALADLSVKAFPALVVAPSLVVEARVWGREAHEWEHLQHLQFRSLVGTPAQRRVRLLARAEVYVVSYENLLWLTDELGHPLEQVFKAIVFDELSKMKHPGTRRFRRMRARAAGVPFRLGLTGSPVGNHLMDLWGEMHMVAADRNPLGPTFGAFQAKWFEPYDYYQRVWGLKGMKLDENRRPTVHTALSRRLEKELHRLVRPFAYARPTAARPGVPPVREVRRRVPLPPEVEDMINDLRRVLWTTLPSGAELEALSRSTVAQKLRQVAGGAVYCGRGDIDRGESPTNEAPPPRWEPVHDAKLRALSDLVDELQGEPLLVYYWYRHERERILAALKGRRVTLLDGAGAIAAWNASRVEVLLAHPQSGGFGLNLQGGGHHLAFFTLPWSRELVDQCCGRLARLGQRASEVVAHLLLCGQGDEDVADVVAGKGATERRLVEAVR